MTRDADSLKIAIQKSGRLSEDSLSLLKKCGIALDNRINKLSSKSYNFPLEVYFLRDDDIPQYVADGFADVGIVGENVFLEKNKKADIVKKLGFGKCRLSLAIPKDQNYSDLSFFQGKSIATSYPYILKKFLEENSVNADLHEISGSVEIAPNIGLADAICDLVSSGSTLFMNGLKEVEVVLKSESILIKNRKLDDVKTSLLNQLIFRIETVSNAAGYKYILLNAPDEKLKNIINLLPGMKSPTIMPLADKAWSSVHTVIKEDDFWNIIEKLKTEGAEGILVIPIEKMIL